VTRISTSRVRRLLGTSDHGATTTERGRAFEDLICYLFELIPGITVTSRNRTNVFRSEEIDVAFWNEKSARGFSFLPNIILCESKDWSSPVGSVQVNWFDTKLRNRGMTLGILVALNGITGEAGDLTAAHHTISLALREQRQIVVMTRRDIESLRYGADLVRLIKQKLCDLAVNETTLS